MQKRLSLAAVAFAAVLAAVIGTLPGCGDDKYVPPDEFLKQVHEEGQVGAVPDASVAPVGAPLDQVPKIRVETNEWDVGTIANDALHHAKLKIYNDGKMPLKITKIDTTCACTQGSIPPERDVIQPGQSTWIDVVVDPRRIPKFETRKVLTIISSDPHQSAVQVGVTSHVDPEYSIDTDDIDAGDIKKGDVVKKTIRFRQIQDQPVTVKGVTVATQGPRMAKVPGVAVEAVPVPEAQWKTPGKREYDINFTIGPDLPAGPFMRYVLLSTDIPRFSGQSLKVHGTVLAPYKVNPLYPVRAMLTPHGTSKKLRAVVHFHADTPIALTHARSKDDALVLEVAPGKTANDADLIASLPAGAMPKTLDDTIRVEVDVDGHAYDEIVGVKLAAPATPHH